MKMKSGKEGRGIVRFTGVHGFMWIIGVELYPGQGKYSRTLILFMACE